MTSIFNKNLFFIICCLFVVSIGFVHYSNAAKTAAFDIDEPIYAVQAAVVAPNALTFWTEVPSNIQPFFYGYLWGTILWLHGHHDIRTYLTQARLMGHQNRPGTLICNVNTLADNLCNNTFTIIREIRTFTPIIATTILFVTWLIGYFFSSYWGGLVVAYLVYSQPLLTYISIRTTADGLLILTMVTVVYVSLLLYKSLRKGITTKSLILYTSMCFFSGVSISTKLNGGFTLIYIAVFLLILLKIPNHIKVAALVLSFILSMSVYIQLHWWIPNANILSLYTERNTIITQQQKGSASLTTLRQKYIAIYEEIIFNKGKMLFPNFNSIYLFHGILLILSFYSILTHIHSDHSLYCILCWTLVIVLGTTLLIPMHWDRYFLPVTVQVAMLEGIGGGILLKKIINV